MNDPEVKSMRRPIPTCLAVAGLLVTVPCALGAALAQDAPAPPSDVVKWVETPTLGATVATNALFDAAATAEGARTQFDAIPADVAFELWLERMVPRKVVVSPPEGEATAPAEKTVVTVVSVPVKEWDEYLAFMMQDAQPGDRSTYRTGLLTELIEQKSMLVYYRDALPEVEQRAAAAVAKLKRGAPFKEVVRVHSEDDTSKQLHGLCIDDTRSGLMAQYPFGKVLFGMQPGEATGPVYNKNAAYILRVDQFARSNNPWYDKVRVSGVCIRYSTGKNLKSKVLGTLKSAVRVRADQDRFKKMLPPAMQVPTPKSFGPSDIAPVGQPDTPLGHD